MKDDDSKPRSSPGAGTDTDLADEVRPSQGHGPPSTFVPRAAMRVLMCIATHRRSSALHQALDELGVPKSTRSYHVRSLKNKGLITVQQGWHAEYAHVRIYEYQLTAVGKILLKASKEAEAEIEAHNASLAFA
jgi:DNA-binding MarR family transcriptional regulator